MFFIMKIAWRNLLRHKGKSVIIGLILFFAAFIMTAGNGVIAGTNKNMLFSMTDSFLGDIGLISTNQEAEDILFQNVREMTSIEGYTNIKSFLEKEADVEKFMPLAMGFSIVMEEDNPAWCYLLGVKFDDFQRFCGNNAVISEGGVLTNGERGVLFSQRWRDHIFEMNGYWILPAGVPLTNSHLMPSAAKIKKGLIIKTNLVFMGMSKDTGKDIRLPVKGVMRYRDYNHMWGYFSLMDIESFRECFNYVTAEDSAKNIPAEKKKIFEIKDDNMDSLFSGSTLTSQNSSVKAYDFHKLKRSESSGRDNLKDIDRGTYNYIAIKLRQGADIEKAVKKLNYMLWMARLDAKAVPWQRVAGMLYDGTSLFMNVIRGFVLFLYFVVIMVIMNTLNMAVIERTGELAMMRSVGARKAFIAKLFYAETFLLTLCFGGAGIIAGNFAVRFLSMMNITVSTQEMAALFFASDHFRPFLGLKENIISIFQLFIFTLIAVLYPIRLALKIKPLEAFSKE